tara:strand:+ start:1190 stop:2707 length:1518 start_codon:yes stop_codon:yes gene_type:complete
VKPIDLNNGIWVYTHPYDYSGYAKVRIKFQTGSASENYSNLGVNHILEHILATHPNKEKEFSFNVETDGSGQIANAKTARYETEYYGTIKRDKVVWFLNNMHAMIWNREITQEELDIAKKAVLVEIGKPNILSEILGFPVQYITDLHTIFSDDSYKSSVFGIKSQSDSVSREWERLNVARITLEQVKSVYKDYYHTNNAVIFISGEFNNLEVANHIVNKWAVLPETNGKKVSYPLANNNISGPYYKSYFDDVSTRVDLGILLKDLSLREELVIRSYLSFLEKVARLELRSERASIYSIYTDIEIDRGWGKVSIGFDSTNDNTASNLEYLKKIVLNTYKYNAFDEDTFELVKYDFAKEYPGHGYGNYNKKELAQVIHTNYLSYGKHAGVLAEFKKIELADYKNILSKYMNDENIYLKKSYAPLFFELEWIFIALLTSLLVAGCFSLRKRQFSRKNISYLINFKKFPTLVRYLMIFFVVDIGASTAGAVFGDHIRQTQFMCSDHDLI